MSHSYSASYFHCIFSTKERKNIIPDDLRPNLWAYIGGIARNLGIVPVAICGTANHAHLHTMRLECLPRDECRPLRGLGPLPSFPSTHVLG